MPGAIVRPAAFFEPYLAASPVGPLYTLLLAGQAMDQEPPAAEPATKPASRPGQKKAPPPDPRKQALEEAVQKAQRDAAQKQAERKAAEPPVTPPPARRLPPGVGVEDAAPQEEPTAAGGEGLTTMDSLTGVSGALRGEVTARAVDSRKIVITGDEQDVDFIESILKMMEETATAPQIEVFPLQSAKAAALAPMIEKVIRAKLDAAGMTGPESRFSINAEGRSNSIIASASEQVLDDIALLIEDIDIGVVPTDIRQIPLEHIRAGEAMSLLVPIIERLNAIREVPRESQPSISVDDRTNSLLITGTPKDIEEIERLIDSIDVELAPTQKQRSFVTADVILIPLQNGSADDIAKTLTDMIKAEQDAAEKVGGGDRKTAGKPYVKQLQLHLPDGTELPPLNLEYPIRIIAEKGTNSLIVFSTQENNEALTAIVNVFDTLPMGPETDVKVFALQHASAEAVAKLLTDTFKDKSYLARPVEGDAKNPPKGQLPPVPPGVAARGLPYPLVVQSDTRSNTVLVIGRADAVLLAGGLIKELDRPSVDLALKPFVLPLKHASASQLADRLEKILADRTKVLGGDKSAALDNAILQPDERSNALIVLATAGTYDMVEDLALQLDAAARYSTVDTRYRLLKYADVVKLRGLLEEMFKSKQDAESKNNKEGPKDSLAVLADTRSNALVLTGTRDYLEEAERVITELDKPFSGTVVFQTFHPRLNSAANVASLLQEAVDESLKQKDSKLSGTPIHIAADPITDALLVAASAEDMSTIERWVETLDRPSEVGRRTQIIPLARARAEDVAKSVQDIFKQQGGGGGKGGGEVDVTVTADKNTNAVIVFAPAALLADVEDVVRRMDGTEPIAGTIVRIFRLAQADAEAAGELLQRILELRGGTVSGTGGGGGGANQQETESQVMLIFQRLNPDIGLETLRGMRQDITVISDIRTNSLVVTAPADSMPLMESLVTAVDVPPEDAQIRVFRLRNADAEQLVQNLETLFERRTQGGGRTGSGTTGDQERILTLEGMGAEGGGRQEVAFTTDVRTNSVIAAGTPGYLKLVEELIYQLDTIPVPERLTDVYVPQNIPAEELAPTLKEFSDAEQARLKEIGEDVSKSVLQERQITAIASKAANRLILDVDPRFRDSVMEVVRSLDQMPPQVMIQVLIVEVTMDNELDLGVEFAFQDLQWAKAGPTDTTTFDYVGGTDLGAAGSGLGGFTFTITGADFNFLFRTLQNEGQLNVLSRPQIVAMDNQEASIEIADDVPYVTGTSTTTGGQITTSVAREQIGIKLTVTPQINTDGFVRLDIEQEVSDFTGSTVDVGQGVTAPVFFRRNAKTNVMVKDHETVVLGGLITSRTENREQKVPLIGDVPGLGLLFRNQTDSKKRTELLLVLTPHVIRSAEDYRALSARERDELEVVPPETLRAPLFQSLQLEVEGPDAPPPRDDQAPLVPREVPGGMDYRAQPEEYGPVRPAIQPQRPPPPPDSYDVPVSFRTSPSR